MTPPVGTRPNVGISPVTPQNAAGIRILPALSVPIPARKNPADTPLALPELDPPDQHSARHGFTGTGNGLPVSGRPMANSIVVVFPTITAPASRTRLTTEASFPACQPGSSTRLCAVVRPS